jgi:hypothetical protein
MKLKKVLPFFTEGYWSGDAEEALKVPHPDPPPLSQGRVRVGA